MPVITNAEKASYDKSVQDLNGNTVQTSVPLNSVFTDTIYDDTVLNGKVDLNTAKVSNVDHPLVDTAVPIGAIFTDTIYDDTAIQAEVDLNTSKISYTDAALVDQNKSDIAIKVSSVPTSAGSPITNMYKLTQVEYDAITPLDDTFYVII